MTLSGGELDHVVADPALAALPFDNGGFAQFAPIKKNMRRHDKNKVSHADVHSAVSDDILRYFIHEGWQTSLHPESPCSYTERFGIKTLTFVRGKWPLGLTVPFLPTAPFKRQAA